MDMTRRLFGTDGIRGTANAEPMTAETVLRLGQAAGLLFTRGAHRHRVVIGKDTRCPRRPSPCSPAACGPISA
jgi:phosphoglucosamine mutase